ncbi:MAG: GntR family transcriptional regulator [Pseudoclavibacter sp.]
MQFDSSAPIWVQLEAEFARRIVVGDWVPGSRMPGVRELASALGVNPNTAQRALAELERRELCRSERTAGRFVTDDQGRIAAAREDFVRGAADAFIERARGMGMPPAAALRLIEERWNDRGDNEQTGADAATDGERPGHAGRPDERASA